VEVQGEYVEKWVLLKNVINKFLQGKSGLYFELPSYYSVFNTGLYY